MVTHLIADILKLEPFSEIVIGGWISGVRKHRLDTFIDLRDATGTIQVVVPNHLLSSATTLNKESAIRVYGNTKLAPKSSSIEVFANQVDVIASCPSDFELNHGSNLLDPSLADFNLDFRHLNLRHPQLRGALMFRHHFIGEAQNWFRTNGFIDISAPILTPVPLYDDSTAIKVNVKGDDVFLTQCVGFYLEAAAMAFGRVFNIGPSFRGEESHSPRHLTEYWHVKAEMTWCRIDKIMIAAEQLVAHLALSCADIGSKVVPLWNETYGGHHINPPFERITYREAIARLNKRGFNIVFGSGLGQKEEEELAKDFSQPFWIVGNSRLVEPFPYIIDPSDSEITMTADLIAPDGYGELLGTAEKICDQQTLTERMIEKGKEDDQRYDWVRQLRDFGCAPHGGFGMGLERTIRWLIHLPHVRDAIPFPRLFRRRIYP